MIDSLLPSILQHENISRITDSGILVRDRRKLPFCTEDILCRDYKEASKAIKEMVTQGGGPLEVALNTLLYTWRHDRDSIDDAVESLLLSRPTNTTMKRTLLGVMKAYRETGDMEGIIKAAFDHYDSLYDSISDIGETLIEDGCGVLTTCFPEHTFMLSLIKAKENGKRVTVYVPETRPYLQGAHLTEPCLREKGIDCYLITDGMPAHFMREGRIQLYMTASDLALKDRTVVNKTGTLANAIAAHYFGIPYYAFSLSLDETKTREDIVIEYRDSDSVKSIGGTVIASQSSKALYPCFDIIEPELVTGIVTEGGIL